MASDRFLVVCESFYSIQGEGKSVGVPSVFLRLAGCNLRCNGFSYKDPESNQHLGCDSKQVWMQGERKTFAEIISTWQEAGWLDALDKGAHLIITGGEPLLQQVGLVNFIKALDITLSKKVFIEIESNATLLMNNLLFQRINQFNLSPKLLHSGESRIKAYNQEALAQFAQSEKANFKFVIATESDVTEVMTYFVKPYRLLPTRIWLMPEGGTRDEINAKKSWLVDLCKQHCFNFTSRLQVDIWGEVVGV